MEKEQNLLSGSAIPKQTERLSVLTLLILEDMRRRQPAEEEALAAMRCERSGLLPEGLALAGILRDCRCQHDKVLRPEVPLACKASIQGDGEERLHVQC